MSSLPADLGDGAILRQLRMIDLDQIWALVEVERERLGEWMPWVQSTKTIDDQRRWLASVTNDDATLDGCGIFLDGRYIGGTGLRWDPFSVRGEIGYWNRPEETALAIRNGWFHTGDVAVMDADGYFRIVDRLKEMVIVSGFNVYPNEVEEVLYRHPKISKVAVIGVPDDRTGETVKAFVVLREGESATPQEIVDWARDPANGLTAYRAPKLVELRDSLPETMVGKVLRRVLAEEERAKAGSGNSSAS